MTSEPVLSVTGLTRTFGAVRAVDDFSLEVESGERHAIVGPNGAGKTTVFNLVSGELRPQSGSIRFEGEEITRASLEERVRKGVGRTFQLSHVFPALTALESVTLAVQGESGTCRSPIPRRRDARTRDKALTTLQRVGLGEEAHVPVRDLSHGSQRQLELALALATEPKLLLLDEPTAGLAPRETEAMVELVVALPRAITLVVIEHDMDVVFSIADRITVMHHGRILTTSTPESVSQNPEVRGIYLGTDV